MYEDDVSISQGETDRAKAVKDLLAASKDLLQIRELPWSKVEADSRLLVVNTVIRRQIESLEASVKLAESNLGHLSVSFVRAAFDEMVWVAYLTQLDREVSQRLLLAMASYDGLRSLMSQREHIGDDAMTKLWYSKKFLDDAERQLTESKAALKELRSELRWPGGALPSTQWIAEQVSELDMYEYLHSATSRAVHFSAGEVFRRGWGDPNGMIATDKAEFRTHLSEFALDRLWRLLFETVRHAMPLLEDSGLVSEQTLTDEKMMPIIKNVLELGQVPIVHAAEWNLRPEGRLPYSSQSDKK
jgi:hypothetical protein